MGHVRIIKMDPGKEFFLGMPRKPGQEGVGHLVRPPLGPERLEHLVVAELVVIEVESLVQAEPGVDVERGDDGRRPVSFFLETLGQGDGLRTQVIRTVVADLVVKGISPGQDRGVGGKGQGRRAVGVGEPHASGGQGVDHRGFRLGPAVGADAIGPGRVQGDQEDVQAVVPPDCRWGGRRRAARRPRPQRRTTRKTRLLWGRTRPDDRPGKRL